MKEQPLISPQEAAGLKARFNPEGSPLRRMQQRMKEMAAEFDRICRRHDIPYWLSSGTLLGCVRHSGFIPWDDDFDVEMLRSDYERLLEILPRELPDWLTLQTPDTDAGYFFCFAKLRDRRSCMTEINRYDRIFEQKGIFIDIFPFEPSPGWLHWITCRTMGFCYRVMNNPRNSDALARRKVRRILWWNRYVLFPFCRTAGRLLPRRYVRYGYGIPFADRRDMKEIFPLTRARFEELELPVPADSEAYLRRKYGDWQRLPDLKALAPHVDRVDFSA
ncbi:MAG: LicD family protein [Prevotellaceae bacterium]|nr:LicD family protein [Prevotellaceae bacterium]